jgi:hypothetical protein
LYVHGNEIVARSMPLLRFAPGGAPPDLSAPRKSPVFRFAFTANASPRTIHEFVMEPPEVRTTNSGGRQMIMATMSQATFEKQPTFAPLADGAVAISSAADYSLEIKNGAGRAARTITRPIAARRVTERDRADAREEQRERLKNGSDGAAVTVRGGGAFFRAGPGGGGKMTDEQIEQNLEQMTFAEEIPSIERIWSDVSGRLWVVRRPERVGRDQPIDLIGTGDRYIGTMTGIRLPAAVSASGLAAWIEKDEFDVERIVVRRLPAEWR